MKKGHPGLMWGSGILIKVVWSSTPNSFLSNAAFSDGTCEHINMHQALF